MKGPPFIIVFAILMALVLGYLSWQDSGPTPPDGSPRIADRR